jgi:hypothetical protein
MAGPKTGPYPRMLRPRAPDYRASASALATYLMLVVLLVDLHDSTSATEHVQVDRAAT